jgi:L-ascorbate metabolism protein UlaG (beta-lactamase superfamily)
LNQKHTRPTHNPELTFIKENWIGNPLDDKGRYRNLYGKSEKNFSQIFKWQLGTKPYKQEKRKQITNVNAQNFLGFKNDIDALVWIGHATFLYQIDTCKILVDPVFYNLSIIKRLTPLPISVEQITDIDVILLSHNHRDHMDKKSMTTICSYNPHAIIYTGLGIGLLLRKWGIKNKIIEAGWYQQYPEFQGVKITYLPSKHWNRRGLLDLNEMLWGGFMIQGKNHSIYFAGDSGIDQHFEEIGNLFPHIDIAMIGIGAYLPQTIMYDAHTQPSEALKAWEMTGARRLIPMHYGTFDLSDEPISQPKEWMTSLLKHHAHPDCVHMIDIGEVLEL